jgi:ATP phosphoribosyltransferase
MSRLIIAIPSKGRLQESTLSLLSAAGMGVQTSGGRVRDYTGSIPSLDATDVLFLQTAEIPAALAEGKADLGITGEDLLRESLIDPDAAVRIVRRLAFGFADLVVAVPRAWIDVETMADLEDLCLEFAEMRGRRLRVATKFTRLTRAFFAERGIADYRIVESLGATEGAPNAGSAEIIVDITSTGETLAANGLKIISDGVILRSEACLVASSKTSWSGANADRLNLIVARLEAKERAQSHVVLTAVGGMNLEEAAKRETGVVVLGDGIFAVPKSAAALVAERLRAAGAEAIWTSQPESLFLNR